MGRKLPEIGSEPLKKFASFLRETRRMATEGYLHGNLLDLFRYLPAWWRSLETHRNTLDDKAPWLAFGAIDFLERFLRRDMLVYEYGSGGSTLYFASRVKKIFSAEHDPAWYGNVMDALRDSDLTNHSVSLFEISPDYPAESGDPADPDGYVSIDIDYQGMSFYEYASSIDKFSDDHFDLILIDGRSRPSCFKHAEMKLKSGGLLVLDNSERLYYNHIHRTLTERNWTKYVFHGLVPYSYSFSETCIWRKL